MRKEYDIIGLGSCAVDYLTKVDNFSDDYNKVTSNNVSIMYGGVTANNITQTSLLGLNVVWAGVLGKDEMSNILLEDFKKKNIKTICTIGGKTQFCWIIVDKTGKRQIYVFPNASMNLTPKVVEERFKNIISKCRHFHTEIAVIPLNAAIAGAKIAKENGCKVFLDIDGDVNLLIKSGIGTLEEAMKLIKMSDVVKISEAGAKSMMKNKSESKLISWILESSELVALTKGEKGCIIATKQRKIFSKGFKVKCADSTGAGDAFFGGLSYALLNEMSVEEAGRFANACGAYCCKKIGARNFGSLNEIKSILKQKNRS